MSSSLAGAFALPCFVARFVPASSACYRNAFRATPFVDNVRKHDSTFLCFMICTFRQQQVLVSSSVIPLPPVWVLAVGRVP